MPGMGYCELCSEKAVVYCPADEASLCWACDTQVHSINFLAKRHVRAFLCSMCNAITQQLVSLWSPTNCTSSICFNCSSEKQNCCIHDELPLSPGAPRSSSENTQHKAKSFSLTSKQTKEGIQIPLSKLPATFTPLKSDVSSTASVVSCNGRSTYKRNRRGDQKCELNVCISSTLSDSTSCSQSWGTKKQKIEKGDNQNNTVSSYKETRPILPGSAKRQTQLEFAFEAKLEAVLSKWHKLLGMVETDTIHLAMHMLQRALQVVDSSSVESKISQVALAVCLSLAARLCEPKACIPSARQIEKCTGVSQKLLQICQMKLCISLGWMRMHEECSESSE